MVKINDDYTLFKDSYKICLSSLAYPLITILIKRQHLKTVTYRCLIQFSSRFL